MHYITGTYFTVNPQLRPRPTPKESVLITGTTYFIFKIQKTEKGATYTFMDQQRNNVQITFSNCREADKIIGMYRREKVPDYEALYSSVTDI